MKKIVANVTEADPESSTMPIARRREIGIATKYKNVRFRSRSEARHAALLDLLGMPWVYEPTDLVLYIPDFILPFGHEPVLVESKADVRLEDLKCTEHVDKIRRSGWDRDFVILGAQPFADSCMGVYGERDEMGFTIDRAIALDCVNCGRVSMVPENGDWRCRRCGAGGDDAHVGWVDESRIAKVWAEAAERVQWKGAAR